MAVRPVLLYPDPRLKAVAEPVGVPSPADLALAHDLVDTMRSHERCVGLAAPQVGAMRRCVVVDVTGHRRAVSCAGLLVCFDPVVEEASGRVVAREGCLSIPDLTGDVVRPERVVVGYTDTAGSRCRVSADAFEARALLHEIDHLDGILFLDRVAGPSAVFRRHQTGEPRKP